MFTSEIRERFLNFFAKREHKIVSSSPVVPHNDPTLLFTNAGMVQFKDIFTGIETRDYSRATTSQKCIRAGGKHNDLEQVGFTARHHTFFEMLGNFSFGDYFKEDAIKFAWDFLTQELQIDKDRLLVTVYHSDEEAANIWKKVAGNVTIIPIHTSDNFWSMGDTGPCGPCSEIFFDHGDSVFGGMPGTKDENGDRYMEIWNIVFMQFEQLAGGEKKPLKKQSIDTGMGLERVAAVMQGVRDNYQNDLFRQIIGDIQDISKTKHNDTFASYKVIADHIRSISFLMADGVVPSNEGRGYVLRRILRRAMRHGNLIGVRDPFLYKISEKFIDIMRDTYPELESARSLITSCVINEEEKFLDTLDRGLKFLQDDIKEIASGGELSGEKAFKLYDTYGFPLDLTQDVLKPKNIRVDTIGFEKALLEQKKRAKWGGSGEEKESLIWHEIKEKIEAVEFIGYEKYECESTILAIVADEKSVKSSLGHDSIFVVTDKTVFYGESGGQCGDTGAAVSGDQRLKIKNTLKFCNTIIAHEIDTQSCVLKVGQKIALKIDLGKRKKIMANHTATHLLQSALRKVLGNHVTQRGSNVNDERLRFDFSHNESIGDDDLLQIEYMVNNWISENYKVACRTMDKAEAMKSGAMALFGEKYDDVVRIVDVHRESEKNEDGCCSCSSNRGSNGCASVSMELCGGCHVSNTSEICAFKILSDASIGSGIRRIEAITGTSVIKYCNQMESAIRSIACTMKCTCSEVEQKTSDLIDCLKNKSKELLCVRQETALQLTEFQKVSDFTVALSFVRDYEIDEMRSLNDKIKHKSDVVIIVNIDSFGNKMFIIVSVSEALSKKYSANNVLKYGLTLIDGKGGGSAVFAQGGGAWNDNCCCADDVLRAMVDYINKLTHE